MVGSGRDRGGKYILAWKSMASPLSKRFCICSRAMVAFASNIRKSVTRSLAKNGRVTGMQMSIVVRNGDDGP